MSTKNVVMKKKIEGVVYDLLVKTSAAQVDYDSTSTVAEKILDLITNKANAADVVTALKASSANGKVTFTKNGTDTDVAVKGVVVAPTYVEETRTLTLPVVKADGTTENVVMNLGKDNFTKSGVFDEKTKKIILTLNNDSTVEIPAAALVDIYTGGTTSSVAVSVSDENVIIAQVRVSSKAGNALSVETEEGKEGLYVAPSTVDSTLNSSSTNAVQNGVVTTELNKKARIIVSQTESEDLTENDIWFQEV